MERSTRNKANESRQAFSEVVAAEAWHAPFGPEARVVDLCVDVVFGTARLGDEAASPIRFRLSVRRAEVVVVVPDVEPVRADPATVSRDTPILKGQKVASLSKSAKRSIGAKLFGSFRGGVLGAGVGGGLSYSRSATTSEQVEGTVQIESMSITQSKSEDGQYRWILVPQLHDALEGRPWDPGKQPRLKLMDQRSNPHIGIPPTVRVEVRCRREDLIVSDLTLKDEGLFQALAARSGFRNRMAAAESFIRDRLMEDGLEVGDMEELFSRLTLASVAAVPVESR